MGWAYSQNLLRGVHGGRYISTHTNTKMETSFH